MTMSSNVSFEDGQLGFVLIPNNSAILKEQASQRMYWPALLFSSCHALCRSIPSTRDQESFRTEWKYLEMVVVNAWKREGLITPDDGPVKVALLLGSDVPPCATRSFPICSRETAVVTGGVLHQPYAILSQKKIDNLKKIQNYAGNHHFQEAIILAEQCMNTNNASVHVHQCALKWLEIPNGSYHGADLHEYTAGGWLWRNREWHRVPALPSEAELERTCPTYKSYPKPPNQESYVQKSSRVANMQLAGAAQLRQRIARKREENARETLMRTGEMHLCDLVMAKIRALPEESLWSETTLITIIHKSRNEWKDSNAQNIPTDDLLDEQDAGISLTCTSSPADSAYSAHSAHSSIPGSQTCSRISSSQRVQRIQRILQYLGHVLPGFR